MYFLRLVTEFKPWYQKSREDNRKELQINNSADNLLAAKTSSVKMLKYVQTWAGLMKGIFTCKIIEPNPWNF